MRMTPGRIGAGPGGGFVSKPMMAGLETPSRYPKLRGVRKYLKKAMVGVNDLLFMSRQRARANISGYTGYLRNGSQGGSNAEDGLDLVDLLVDRGMALASYDDDTVKFLFE